jgi:AcrR family transcriptional regulator
MSPKKNSNISDQGSVNVKRRGRPSAPSAPVLQAAAVLFAETESPATVTMDAIAAAAKVGKGTLFRAFGSREGLLNALWAAKLMALRDSLEEEDLSPRSATASLERAIAFLDTILIFKLKNVHLIRALELGPGVLRSEHYKWMHGTLRHFIEDAVRGAKAGDAVFAAHVLLAGLHIDLVEEMIAGGLSIEQIRQAQAAHAKALISGHRDC